MIGILGRSVVVLGTDDLLLAPEDAGLMTLGAPTEDVGGWSSLGAVLVPASGLYAIGLVASAGPEDATDQAVAGDWRAQVSLAVGAAFATVVLTSPPQLGLLDAMQGARGSESAIARLAVGDALVVDAATGLADVAIDHLRLTAAVHMTRIR